ncbi:MAG: Rieske 2Fe-2S domain-containing protein [Acidimicrobiia bacterium]|nr:Rieske 2Fe-2S domain-containing protein [Acidimicrobiia bacterium]
MDASTLLVIAIGAVLVLAVVGVLAVGRRRAGTGTLSRETRRRDAGARQAEAVPGTAVEPADVDAEARQRAAEAREAAVPARAGARVPAERVPVDEEALGETRRQFFNRGIVGLELLALGGFGAACIAFLWPKAGGGFGGQVSVGTGIDDILQDVADKKQPFYVPEARSYVVPYPQEDLDKARAVYTDSVVRGIEEAGIVVLYQKCPHLGCRVPFCDSSQWFECPCHGSKYNRVGEKRGGPAPRGMDHFPAFVDGNRLTIDTSVPIEGPPIGTDTTGQGAEGPPCV